MKKLISRLGILAIVAGLLTGCVRAQNPEGTAGSEKKTSITTRETEPAESSGKTDIFDLEDTYWVACQFQGNPEASLQPLDPSEWLLDLIIRTDGTARFRDIQDGTCLKDEANLNLTWHRAEDGTLLFSNGVYSYYVVEGTLEDGVLTAQYQEFTLKMKQLPMPETAGELYSPAELAGSWIMVSGETEGYTYDSMPWELESLVFRQDFTDDGAILIADMEHREIFSEFDFCLYDQQVEVLEKPLFDGCGNEMWSVRIGPVSPVNKDGYPLQTEFYATLLDRNTLLLQRYYTIDGYPAVSCQTFLRILPQQSWWEVEASELKYTNWVCTGFVAADGTEYPALPQGGELRLCLNEDGTCTVTRLVGDSETYAQLQADWVLSSGGVFQIRGGEDADETRWYIGAIRGYCAEADGEYVDRYEMFLYCEGGILRLVVESCG